jgi:predicted 3-demethylubiquinone-9 3-methyltransferase (glyoxalase superfamily)
MDDTASTRGENTEYQAPEMTGTILAVRPKADLKNTFRVYAQFTTEEDAIDWVKDKAGIQ